MIISLDSGSRKLARCEAAKRPGNAWARKAKINEVTEWGNRIDKALQHEICPWHLNKRKPSKKKYWYKYNETLKQGLVKLSLILIARYAGASAYAKRAG